MKKYLIYILTFVLLCSLLSGCGNTAPETPKDTPPAETDPTDTDAPSVPAFEGTVTEILDALVAKAGELDAGEFGITSIEVSDVAVDTDTCGSILGLTTEEFESLVESAVESKPEGSWFAHSVVVIELKDNIPVAETAEKIIAGTKPNRFGCIQAKKIVGGYAGQYVFFCASDEGTADAVYAAFEALSAIDVTRVDRENDWSGSGGLLIG